MFDHRKAGLNDLAIILLILAREFFRQQVMERTFSLRLRIGQAEKGGIRLIIEQKMSFAIFDVNQIREVVDQGAQQVAFIRQGFFGMFAFSDVLAGGNYR